jgi:hypothetical protein
MMSRRLRLLLLGLGVALGARLGHPPRDLAGWALLWLLAAACVVWLLVPLDAAPRAHRGALPPPPPDHDGPCVYCGGSGRVRVATHDLGSGEPVVRVEPCWYCGIRLL